MKNRKKTSTTNSQLLQELLLASTALSLYKENHDSVSAQTLSANSKTKPINLQDVHWGCAVARSERLSVR